jgi:hypothetical protein
MIIALIEEVLIRYAVNIGGIQSCCFRCYSVAVIAGIVKMIPIHLPNSACLPQEYALERFMYS